jgi:hypothetical protein
MPPKLWVAWLAGVGARCFAFIEARLYVVSISLVNEVRAMLARKA